MKKITEMDGFAQLTTGQKIEVLNLKENFDRKIIIKRLEVV